MDRARIDSIFTSAIGLFAAVSVAYLTTWFNTHDLATAQTMAFVTWLVGHVLVAFNLRSEHEPLVCLGFVSNRLMIYWAAATMVFVTIITRVRTIRLVLKIGTLSSSDWVLAIGAAVISTFWMEARKLMFFQRVGRNST